MILQVGDLWRYNNSFSPAYNSLGVITEICYESNCCRMFWYNERDSHHSWIFISDLQDHSWSKLT